jgi:1-acyl-sn-glycerol-3-phosphate acyltransferase
MLVGEVKIVGTLPEGPVLLCGNHNSYRDVFLFGMIRSSARLLVHPFKTGAVRIAQQAGVPMVPVYFHYGNYPGRWVTPFSITVQNMILFCLWPFYRRGVTIFIGAPIDPSGEVREKTRELKAAVVGLKPGMRV